MKNLVYSLQVIILLHAVICISCARAVENITFGGDCTYEKHKGVAKIISILPLKDFGNHSTPKYKVTFSFEADLATDKTLQHTQRKLFILLLKNSSYPSQKFLHRYKIKVGSNFESYMYQLIKGTCSPQYFEFPTIQLDDYF